MKRFLRSLFGCSRREAEADEAGRRQDEDHAIAMLAVNVRLESAQTAANASERAAKRMLRHLKEDFPP